MPELPDLQVFARNLNKLFAGKKLEKFRIVWRKRIKTTQPAFSKALEKQKLQNVERIGKELHFNFNNGSVLGIHMMLHGGLHLFEKKNDAKYTIVEMVFEKGKGLALTDFQGMAIAYLNPKEKDAPDALSKKITFRWMKQSLQNEKKNIKTVLMDQDIIRGIGNAYADEILWEAGISPFSIASKIPDQNVKELVKAIRSVLKNAEKQIQKKDPDIISGEIREFLKIHNSKKKQSPTGGKILQKPIASRKTYYTNEQKVFK